MVSMPSGGWVSYDANGRWLVLPGGWDVVWDGDAERDAEREAKWRERQSGRRVP